MVYIFSIYLYEVVLLHWTITMTITMRIKSQEFDPGLIIHGTVVRYVSCLGLHSKKRV